MEKAEYYFSESAWFAGSRNFEKALICLKKALKLRPDNQLYLEEMVRFGYDMDDSQVQLEGLSRLYDSGQMDDEYLPSFLDLLARNGQYRQALDIFDRLLIRLAGMKLANKRRIRSTAIQIQEYCRHQLRYEKAAAEARKKNPKRIELEKNKTPERPLSKPGSQKTQQKTKPVPNIPVRISIDDTSFQMPLSSGRFQSYEHYALALEGHQIRFRDSFDFQYPFL